MLTEEQEKIITTASEEIIRLLLSKDISYIECEMILFMSMEAVKNAKMRLPDSGV